jgi:23S rRNA (cytosine1962-C5)-methyltransferase
MIEQSADAVAAAERNAAANGLAGICRFTNANVFDWLKAAASGASDVGTDRYDLIVLDPPPFAPNRAALPGALRGYKEIHLRALKLLVPGGLLATFCCSHHLDAREFEQVIVAAARDAHRVLRRVAIYTQPPDHPVLPAIPETEYLKGYAYEVLGA